MKIVSNLGPYLKTIKVFIVNIPKDFKNAGRKDFKKVHVHGCYFRFPLTIINEYLERGKFITADKVSSQKVIT